MTKRLFFTVRSGSPIIFRDPNEGGGGGEASASEGATATASEGGGESSGSPGGDGGQDSGGGGSLSREAMGFVKDQIRRATRSMVTNEALESFGNTLVDRLSPQAGSQGGQAETGSEAQSPDPGSQDSGSSSTEDVKANVRLQLVETELKRSQKAHKELTDQLAEERRRVALKERDHSIVSTAQKLGATDPSDVLALTNGDAVQDEKTGEWGFKVKTEFGDDIVSAEEHIGNLLTKKPYLKKAVVREGSGASSGASAGASGDSGSGVIDGRRVTRKALKDVSWYEKNAAAIDKYLQSSASIPNE